MRLPFRHSSSFLNGTSCEIFPFCSLPPSPTYNRPISMQFPNTPILPILLCQQSPLESSILHSLVAVSAAHIFGEPFRCCTCRAYLWGGSFGAVVSAEKSKIQPCQTTCFTFHTTVSNISKHYHQYYQRVVSRTVLYICACSIGNRPRRAGCNPVASCPLSSLPRVPDSGSSPDL